LKVKPPTGPSSNQKMFKVKKEESDILMLGGGYYKAQHEQALKKKGFIRQVGSSYRLSLFQQKIQLDYQNKSNDKQPSFFYVDLQRDNKKMYIVVNNPFSNSKNEMPIYMKQAT